MLKSFNIKDIQELYNEILNKFKINLKIDGDNIESSFTKIDNQIYFICKNSKDTILKNTFKNNRKIIKDFQINSKIPNFKTFELTFSYKNKYDYKIDNVIDISYSEYIISSDFHGDINRLLIWLKNIGLLNKTHDKIVFNKDSFSKKIYYLGDSQTIKVSSFNIERNDDDINDSTNIFGILLFFLQQFGIIKCIVGNHDILEHNKPKHYINKIFSSFYPAYIYDKDLDILFSHCPMNVPVRYIIKPNSNIGTLPLINLETVNDNINSMITNIIQAKSNEEISKFTTKELFFEYINNLSISENIFWPKEYIGNKRYFNNIFNPEYSNELFPQWEGIKNICGHCSMPTFPDYIQTLLNDESWNDMINIDRFIDYSKLEQGLLTKLLNEIYISNKGFSFSIDTLRYKFVQKDQINPHIPILTIDSNKKFILNMIYFSKYYPEKHSNWKLTNNIIGGSNKKSFNFFLFFLAFFSLIVIILTIIVIVQYVSSDRFIKHSFKFF